MNQCKLIIFLSLSILFLSQEIKATGLQEQIYSVMQLREDFDFYVRKLKELHPGLYSYCSQKAFNKRVRAIKKQINKPMGVSEFGIIAMNLNSYIDGHSGIPFGSIRETLPDKKRKEIEAYKDSNGKFLPFMQVHDNKLFFNGEEVLAINQQTTKEIMAKFGLKITDHDSKKRSDFIKSHYLFTEKYSFIFYNLTSPFKIKTKSTTGDIKTVTEEGWSSSDYNKFVAKESKPWKAIDYTIYPDDSIACIDFNSCYRDDYGSNKMYEQTIDSIFTQINSAPVKNLFINITSNEGGSYAVAEYMFNQINRDAYFWDFTTITNYGKTIDTNYEGRYYNEVRYGFSGNVFVIQSPWTFSAADDFCRLTNANKRCVLVGEPTGQRNTTITESRKMKLPHTNLSFNCARKKYIYSDCDEDGLCPDIPFKISIYKNSFYLKELKQILHLWEVKKQ